MEAAEPAATSVISRREDADAAGEAVSEEGFAGASSDGIRGLGPGEVGRENRPWLGEVGVLVVLRLERVVFRQVRMRVWR